METGGSSRSKRKRGKKEDGERKVGPCPRAVPKDSLDALSESKLTESVSAYLLPGKVGDDRANSGTGSGSPNRQAAVVDPRNDICRLWKTLLHEVEGEKLMDPVVFRFEPPAKRVLRTVAAAPLPGYAMHALAAQDKRSLPLFLVSKEDVCTENPSRICPFGYGRGGIRTSPYTPLSNSDISAILENPKKIPFDSVDMVTMSSYAVMISALTERIQNSFERIGKKLYRSKREELRAFSISRMVWISADAKWYVVDPDAPWLVFASTVRCLVVEITPVNLSLMKRTKIM